MTPNEPKAAPKGKPAAPKKAEPVAASAASGPHTMEAGNCSRLGSKAYTVTPLGNSDLSDMVVTKCCDGGDAKQAFYTHHSLLASKRPVKVTLLPV